MEDVVIDAGGACFPPGLAQYLVRKHLGGMFSVASEIFLYILHVICECEPLPVRSFRNDS